MGFLNEQTGKFYYYYYYYLMIDTYYGTSP